MDAIGRLKSATLEITVTRADGTVEELGVVCEAHFDEDGNQIDEWVAAANAITEDPR